MHWVGARVRCIRVQPKDLRNLSLFCFSLCPLVVSFSTLVHLSCLPLPMLEPFSLIVSCYLFAIFVLVSSHPFQSIISLNDCSSYHRNFSLDRLPSALREGVCPFHPDPLLFDAPSWLRCTRQQPLHSVRPSACMNHTFQATVTRWSGVWRQPRREMVLPSTPSLHADARLP